MKTVLLALLLVLSSIFNSAAQNQTESQPVKRKTIVLTIDGGGIRGIIPAYLLSQIEAAFKADSLQIYQLVDVIGGTSTGGMMAIGLTAPQDSSNRPRTAEKIMGFYLNDCGSIFCRNRQLFGPDYYAMYGFEPFFKSRLLPRQTLADAARLLEKKRVRQVFAATYIVNSTGGTIPDPKMGIHYGPYLFNWHDATMDGKDNYYLWEAVRATSAAPTYYPLANVGGGKTDRSSAAEKWTVDGGIMSVDPSLWGVTESLRTGIATSLDDILVISLGCGIDRYDGGLEVTDKKNHQCYGEEYGFWGGFDWDLERLRNLKGEKTGRSVITETSISANRFVAESQLKSLAQGTGLEYYRVDPELTSDLLAFDHCDNAQKLKAFAEEYFSKDKGKAQLDTLVELIRRNL